MIIFLQWLIKTIVSSLKAIANSELFVETKKSRKTGSIVNGYESVVRILRSLAILE
jgi:hypothetical protein